MATVFHAGDGNLHPLILPSLDLFTVMRKEPVPPSCGCVLMPVAASVESMLAASAAISTGCSARTTWKRWGCCGLPLIQTTVRIPAAPHAAPAVNRPNGDALAGVEVYGTGSEERFIPVVVGWRPVQVNADRGVVAGLLLPRMPLWMTQLRASPSSSSHR